MASTSRRRTSPRRPAATARAKHAPAKSATAKPAATHAFKPLLLVGTRKGAFIYRGDRKRSTWTLDGPHFLGCVVHHLVQDPRDRRVLLMAVRTGHLGPTIQRSLDGGKTWKEATRPPAFLKAAEGETGRAVEFTCWLTPGHALEPGVWYAGVSPHGLFRSSDGGVTWDGVEGFNRGVVCDPAIAKFIHAVPEGGFTHSVLVDPRDPAHLYAALSVGGLFESRDAGASWTPLNRGIEADFLPSKDTPYGHDPHCVALHPLQPDRLWQQNHCGIYRLDRPGEAWTRVGRAMPREVGDIGFPIVPHPRDPDTAWVFPMDGTAVWPRTSPDGKPAVYRTSDAGASWQRQDRGLPRRHAWLTVKRQAFRADAGDPVGLCFGTTSGELWSSRDEGRTWTQLAAHLPHIFSVAAAEAP